MKIRLILFLIICGYTLCGQDMLEQFQSPPKSAKPRVWWHWMNGNVTKEGIQKDLEWMERVGIGGFQNFDANLFTPVIVPKKLVFMQPDWKDAFRFATELADKKGLEMAIAGSPGWSVTGGPWVKNEDGMKKYVFTETTVTGGQNEIIKLKKPSDKVGKIQDVELAVGITGDHDGDMKNHFYQDALVVAYKLPDTEKNMIDLKPTLLVSGGKMSLEDLTDNNWGKTFDIPPTEIGKDMWVQYGFDLPQTFKSFSFGVAPAGGLAEFNGLPDYRSLKVSDDGVTWRTVAKIPGTIIPVVTISIPETTAKYWRLCLETLPGEFNPIAAMMGGGSALPPPLPAKVSEFILYSTDRINQAEDKAGFTPWKEIYTSSNDPSSDAIQLKDIIDLTDKMKEDGTLSWSPPKGRWNVIRMGYSLTGRQNHPASPEATGLEVDKLDPAAVTRYINSYLDLYKDATGGMMGGRGLQYMILDSYEAGHMNWTTAMPTEFKKRRGYDLVKWVPVLTGRVVENINASEQFLWDFRKSISEMISDNHYDIIGQELHKRGMKRYTESHEGGRIYLADGMDVKRNADIPMAAMWTPGSLVDSKDEEVRSEADIREAASVANIYGQNIVAAESMTAVKNAFSWYPAKLKRTADLEMASGLNRFVIHTSVHQPLDDKVPGFSLGPFGQYFTRQETWSEVGGKAWMSYLGRSSYLLQQGKNVADILYLYGENTNITTVSSVSLPNIPKGYEFDYVNATALNEAIKIQDGKIVSKGGTSYNVLMLDESTQLMTLSLLKRIKSLADDGIKIIGKKPSRSPSLADDANEFKQIADALWSSKSVVTFDQLNLSPDVIIKNTTHKILYRHRKSDVDIYWLNNRNVNPTTAEVSFRITGKKPQLWNPQTGKTEEVSYRFENGRIVIPLKFESWDAFFIVFKNEAAPDKFEKASMITKPLLTINSPWTINFQTGRGAPASLTLPKLISLSENSIEGVKYFSGTASYNNTIKVKKVNKKAKYFLELGEVNNIAEVFVNGKNMGVLWKAPFNIDITDGLKKGSNAIEIKVTNTWVNRLIGDAQPKVKEKITFTAMPFYRGQEPLLPSGLVGEVKILLVK
jgi:hypothetical protein